MTPADFRAAREAWGLCQSELAPLLGLGAAPRVSHIETGAKPISNQVRRLMQAYIDGYRPADWPQTGTDQGRDAVTDP